ncbi:MAG: hypothetical protein FWF51_02360 [Chitinivibrionia bacterium]|nr:hypothetical protein [Chitinivibrionia bacterium]
MEDLLYILLFVFIVGVNLLIKNKGAIGKMFDSLPDFENGKKYAKSFHKQVQNKQKLYRRKNTKYCDNIVPVSQPLSEISARNSRNFEISKLQNLQKPQNITQSSPIFLKGKTLKEAFVLKEILDLPVGLR